MRCDVLVTNFEDEISAGHISAYLILSDKQSNGNRYWRNSKIYDVHRWADAGNMGHWHNISNTKFVFHSLNGLLYVDKLKWTDSSTMCIRLYTSLHFITTGSDYFLCDSIALFRVAIFGRSLTFSHELTRGYKVIKTGAHRYSWTYFCALCWLTQRLC